MSWSAARTVSKLTVAGASLAAACSKPAPSHPLRIAAAADLAAAFADVGKAFEKKTGVRPTFSFGSTGLLEEQIEEGGPFDVFAAANVSFADRAVRSGACDGATQTLYARGRIVVYTPKVARLAPPASIAGLADPRFDKIAIANPEHAPYGIAARQALEHAGIWERVKSRVVFGENVQQALAFAQTGNADAAIVALSLVLHAKDGTCVPIEPTFYAPIDQAMVVCKGGGNAGGGKRFLEFANGPEGRAIMRRYGFLLPGESLAESE